MSEQMKQFLTEWLAWAEADAPVHPVFKAHRGLCSNLYQWSCDNPDISVSKFAYLGCELTELFNSEVYPFGKDDYMRDYKSRTQHRNGKRLAWVREQLA